MVKEVEKEVEKVKKVEIKFTEEQNKIIEYMKSNIDKREIVIITGVAGSGKTFTILKMFEEMKDLVKKKKICFAGPTNMVVDRNKKYGEILNKCFKKVDFMTICKLLNEKQRYDEGGNLYFEIKKGKNGPIYQYDIIIIDEISMIEDKCIDYIKSIKKDIGLCIFIGDKNQLNPVNSNELKLFNDSIINLKENMRCNNKEINEINKYLIDEISNYDEEKYDFNEFMRGLYSILYKYKNNENIRIIENEDDLVELYIKLYEKKETIIGNYRNEECGRLNRLIKERLVKKNNIKQIDEYFVGQQVIFLEQYEEWNTSELGTIKVITQEKYKFKKLKTNDLIMYNKNFKKTKISTEVPQKCNYYKMEDENGKLLKSQEIFNYLIHMTNTIEGYTNVFKKLNGCENIIVNMITLNEKCKIRTIVNSYKNDYENNIKDVREEIKKLVTYVNNNEKKHSKLYNEYIIEGLWGLLNKHRIDVLAKIDSAFACTIHRLQGCSIDNIVVNLVDIFRLNDNNKNKLKCIYTCFSRCRENLVVYLLHNPICKCNIFTVKKYDNKLNENYWLCEKKCGYFEHIKDGVDSVRCNNCKKIYYKTMINKYNICYECCIEI